MIKLRYGNTNTYYVNGLLIDTDMPNTLSDFYKELKRNGLTIEAIRYVLATHYHPDHMGLIGQLMSFGISLILVDKQKDSVHFSDAIFARQPELNYQPIDENGAFLITCEESRKFLQTIGISGEIVPTASHSMDGIALITDDGNCFVGDLEPEAYIEAYGKGAVLQQDWNRIRAYHPVNAYFGHINDQRL
ncbi:MAG: MBL fold metallo-hydrolase [Lachnospiraceae bacterium]|nr:MBL fold metallo-hydrolase [Lachnospiraceae bacterium]